MQRLTQTGFRVWCSAAFLARRADVDWVYREGLNQFFPKQWRRLTEILDDEQTPLLGYQALMNSDNELERMDAAKRFAAWEAECANLRPDSRLVRHLTKALKSAHDVGSAPITTPTIVLLRRTSCWLKLSA